MEAAVEYFFNFWSFKGDSLEVSFVVVVKEGQRLSRVCGQTGQGSKQTSVIYAFTFSATAIQGP